MQLIVLSPFVQRLLIEWILPDFNSRPHSSNYVSAGEEGWKHEKSHAVGHGSCKYFGNKQLLLQFLFDTGSFTLAATQVENAGAANFTLTEYFNFVDTWRNKGEYSFHTYTI